MPKMWKMMIRIILNMPQSFLFSFFECVESSFFLEVDLDVSVGKLFICTSDGVDSLLKEVLLRFVEGDLLVWSSIESDSGPVADDDAREQ